MVNTPYRIFLEIILIKKYFYNGFSYTLSTADLSNLS
jgi:hypothetical protein